MEEDLTFDPALFFDNVEVLGDISSGLVKVDTLTPNSKDFIAVGNGVTVSKAGLVVGVVTAVSDFNDDNERINGLYYDSSFVRFNATLLPAVHNSFDLGNAEYKVRDVYEDPGSDERIKEDIVPFTGALNFVNQIPVVSFTFKDIDYNEHTRGKRETGFIAQDVKKALDNSDYESYRLWSENPESYQGLDKKQMIPALTAAIQELSKKVDAIEKRLDKLT